MSRKNPEGKPCRRTGLALRPAPQAPGRTLSDPVVRQVFDLVRHSGVLERLPSNEPLRSIRWVRHSHTSLLLRSVIASAMP